MHCDPPEGQRFGVFGRTVPLVSLLRAGERGDVDLKVFRLAPVGFFDFGAGAARKVPPAVPGDLTRGDLLAALPTVPVQDLYPGMRQMTALGGFPTAGPSNGWPTTWYAASSRSRCSGPTRWPTFPAP